MQIGPLSDLAVAGESKYDDGKNVPLFYLVARSLSTTTLA
jgi:hypothetical protein